MDEPAKAGKGRGAQHFEAERGELDRRAEELDRRSAQLDERQEALARREDALGRREWLADA